MNRLVENAGWVFDGLLASAAIMALAALLVVLRLAPLLPGAAAFALERASLAARSQIALAWTLASLLLGIVASEGLAVTSRPGLSAFAGAVIALGFLAGMHLHFRIAWAALSMPGMSAGRCHLDAALQPLEDETVGHVRRGNA